MGSLPPWHILTGAFRYNFRCASIFMQIGSKHLVGPADWYSRRHAAHHFPPRFIVQNSAPHFYIDNHSAGRSEGEQKGRGMWDGWVQSRQWRHAGYSSVSSSVGRPEEGFTALSTTFLFASTSPSFFTLRLSVRLMPHLHAQFSHSANRSLILFPRSRCSPLYLHACSTDVRATSGTPQKRGVSDDTARQLPPCPGFFALM